jgi:nitrate reductase NapAB chaperone NapD
MGWREIPKQGDFSVLYSYKNKYYFGIIPEPYGTKDGITVEALRTAIIENVATVAKIKPKDIPVIDSSDSIEGHPELKSITYTASLPNIRSMNFVYHNVIHLSDHTSVQYLFWGVGKNLSSDFKSVIKKTLDNTTFK